MADTDPFIFDSPEFRCELENSPHEAGEVEFIESLVKPGMRVIDAGGHRGVTAVAIARKIGGDGRLFVFEPVPEYYGLLVENLARNGVNNAETFELALGAEAGRVRFYKHGGGSGITPAEGAEPLQVETVTVDGFLENRSSSRIDLLNMDCEGAELFVFRGAASLLQGHAPQVFCEIHPEYLGQLSLSVEDVAGFLEKLGYEVTPLDVEDLGREAQLDDCSHIHARKPGPVDRIEELQSRIEDLKERMPAHSTLPSMMLELEELEEEIAELRKAWEKGDA